MDLFQVNNFKGTKVKFERGIKAENMRINGFDF